MKQSKWLLSSAGFLAAAQIVSASTGAGRFEVIARENAFRLRPPASEAKPQVPTAKRRQITLHGFTTILGRAQVLLNIQTGVSCVICESENQDGVTILEINVKTETVRLTNLGLEEIVTLKR